jgi:hypothetical protein
MICLGGLGKEGDEEEGREGEEVLLLLLEQQVLPE